MGKGDTSTRKGKITNKSYGKVRSRKKRNQATAGTTAVPSVPAKKAALKKAATSAPKSAPKTASSSTPKSAAKKKA